VVSNFFELQTGAVIETHFSPIANSMELPLKSRKVEAITRFTFPRDRNPQESGESRPRAGKPRVKHHCEARDIWKAALAQLVEHVIRNDGVAGSSPACGTSFL
jgi:hypothetical protein